MNIYFLVFLKDSQQQKTATDWYVKSHRDAYGLDVYIQDKALERKYNVTTYPTVVACEVTDLATIELKPLKRYTGPITIESLNNLYDAVTQPADNSKYLWGGLFAVSVYQTLRTKGNVQKGIWGAVGAGAGYKFFKAY